MLRISSKITILTALLFFGCSTTIPVKVRKPAKLNIGSARTIAVMDFEFTGSWDFRAGEKMLQSSNNYFLKH